MNKLTHIVAAGALLVGMVGTANAVPILQISSDAAGSAPLAGNAEAIGDPGGTNYANVPTIGATNGPGLPTVAGGWPNSPNFAPDSYGVGGNGITGYDGSYLNLTEAGTVTFQFMGKGDASNHNLFQVDLGAGWVTIWDNQSAANGTCGVSGTTPVCPNPGSEVSYSFNAGLIPFQFVNLTNPATATNDGSNNPRPDLEVGIPSGAGYFLGIDPYLATGQWDITGKVAYAGFTDLPCTPGAACDHDYEDLIVRMSVPEPGSIFLLGAGLLGLGFGRRKLVRNA